MAKGKGKPVQAFLAKRGAAPGKPPAMMAGTTASPNTGSPSQVQGFRKGGKVKKGKK